MTDTLNVTCIEVWMQYKPLILFDEDITSYFRASAKILTWTWGSRKSWKQQQNIAHAVCRPIIINDQSHYCHDYCLRRVKLRLSRHNSKQTVLVKDASAVVMKLSNIISVLSVDQASLLYESILCHGMFLRPCLHCSSIYQKLLPIENNGFQLKGHYDWTFFRWILNNISDNEWRLNAVTTCFKYLP